MHTPVPSVNKAALSGFETPEETSSKVQNSGPTKMTYVLQKLKKQTFFLCYHITNIKYVSEMYSALWVSLIKINIGNGNNIEIDN